MLTAQDKKYLKFIVQKELEHFKSDQKTLFIDLPVRFLKGEHEYKHFLEEILKKLG